MNPPQKSRKTFQLLRLDLTPLILRKLLRHLEDLSKINLLVFESFDGGRGKS